MTAPLTPLNCNLQDFPRMMIDIPRLRGSEFDATLDDAAWRAGLNLWMTAWHQVPAASLPDDDANLAKHAGLGRDVKTWRKIRSTALRGWVKCNDGLLYHPVVAEMALEAWLEKLVQALSSGAGNQKRWGADFDPAPIEGEIERCADLLAALNPKSKALVKLARRKSRTPSEPHPDGKSQRGENASHRDAGNIPSGSQGTGTGKGIEESEPDGSGAAAPFDDDDELDPLAELRALPLAKGCWRLALKVLTEQGRLSDPKARSFVGKLKAGGLTDDELWEIAEAAWREQTEAPQPYLVKAAEGAIARRQSAAPDPMLLPEAWRQRKWMEEFVEGTFRWNPQRGPEPGQPGCRVAPDVQREFNVEPAGPHHRSAA